MSISLGIFIRLIEVYGFVVVMCLLYYEKMYFKFPLFYMYK